MSLERSLVGRDSSLLVCSSLLDRSKSLLQARHVRLGALRHCRHLIARQLGLHRQELLPLLIESLLRSCHFLLHCRHFLLLLSCSTLELLLELLVIAALEHAQRSSSSLFEASNLGLDLSQS